MWEIDDALHQHFQLCNSNVATELLKLYGFMRAVHVC